MQDMILDKRVLKTKKLLEESLFNLLKSKNINKITVRELTASIDINRSTFYDHYTDVYDLLESVQDRLLDDIYSLYKNVIISDFNDKEFNALFKILDYIKNNKEIFKILLNGYNNLLFVEKLKKAIAGKFTDDFIGKIPIIDEKYYSLLSSFFVSGCIGLIQEWLKNDTKMSTIELTEIIRNLIIRCIL